MKFDTFFQYFSAGASALLGIAGIVGGAIERKPHACILGLIMIGTAVIIARATYKDSKEL